MSLFQQSVIKKHISDLDENKLQQGWNHFESYFKDNAQQQIINESKEEEFQVLFLTNLFDKCLGFNIDGINKNLFIEYKNVTSSEKADGAIKINDEVVAVIELKSTKTKGFKEIQKQAFGYKVSHPNCKYVVTSNFNKLRFYIENATAFEEFDLFNLTYERFKLLWLCLSFESVSSGIPLKIKSESTLNEENITKKLYKDYSLFRKEVFNDIVEKNQQYDKLTLFNKTQKLLDRFLFIFFAEDRRLLPVNSISKIIEKWEDDIAYGDEKSLYTSFKLYFNLLNKGRPASAKREGIFAYNGGLFAPDEILNSISIDDKLLSKHTKNLSTYDFESDVSVNILGHIFEHSLSEIEEIQNEITGVETDKTSSKRKKDGVFYTPSYITKYIVENTVGKLCQEKKEELEINEEVYTQRKARSKKRIDNLDAYRNWLLGITICDPACGSGAFLVQALDFLIEEHKYIDELNAAYHGASIPFSDITSSILENNLYGVDINGESVEIAKLSLWLRTAQKGRKLTSLSDNLKCGNSLIDDPEVAGDKAFNWKNEFPEVFTNGGFDVVIGNPPYVSHDRIDNKQNLKDKFITYSSFGDLYIFFYELAYNILNNNGLSSLITSNSFLKAEYGKPIRKFLKDNSNIKEVINIENTQIFSDAVVNTVILTFSKLKTEQPALVVNSEFQGLDFNTFINNNKMNYNQTDFLETSWNLTNPKIIKLQNKIKGSHKTLKQFNTKIRLGIATGDNNAFVITEDLKNNLILKDPKNQEIIKPILRGRDIGRYSYNLPNLYLILTKNGVDVETEYPYIYEYLDSFGDNFKNRGAKGQHWTNLRSCSFFDDFKLNKIVWIELTNRGRFTTCNDEIYLLNSAYFLLPPKEFNTSFLLSILNSSIIEFYLRQTANTSGVGTTRWINNYVKEFPIPEIPLSAQTPYIKKAELMLSLNNNLQMISNKFVKFLKSELLTDNLGNYIEKWYLLDWNEFKIELMKKKIVFSGVDKEEWYERFTRFKEEAQSIKSLIDKTDKEIDQMVYELYGLTQEEIEIVENATK